MRSMGILAHAGFSAASVLRQAVIAQDRQHVGCQQCVDEQHDDHALRMRMAGESRVISRRAPDRCNVMLRPPKLTFDIVELHASARCSLCEQVHPNYTRALPTSLKSSVFLTFHQPSE